jgi:hypothetical protein
VYFIQTSQEVWVLWQRDHTVRRIYLNREHTVKPKPSWFGAQVTRRKVSGGTRSDVGRDCRNAFIGLAKTRS